MKTYPVILFMLCACSLFGQRTTVEGTVTDSAAAALPAATVVIMTPDSVMSGYGLTDDAGKFSLRIKGPGRFLLQISYLGYETHWRELSLEAGQEKVALGAIPLSVSSAVLPFVEITSDFDPMRLSRDTVEYNAAAFKVQPGAVVEDLLKKLPGVEVQRDGTVKAHGETVQNVLVDGKEFFGKDTRVATKNLPAEAVDRVQVFDKQSDMAEFTGIDDGQEERTINLKLKEGHKHGYFGKADAGAGTEGRYEGRFNVNRFSPDNRLSAIGMANNTNEIGFSMDDYIQMMGGMGAMMSGGGISIGGGDDGGIPLADQRAGNGIRTSLAGGLNWSKDFSRKTELTASYFQNRFQNDLQQSRFRENLAESGTFTGQETDDQWSRNLGHNLNLHFRHKIDSFQNIILRANGSMNDALLENLGTSAAFSSAGTMENEGRRDYRSDGGNYNVRSSLTYRRRFRRQGRAVVAQGTLGANAGGSEGMLDAVNRFFSPVTVADTLVQRQEVDSDGSQYALSLSYTEPLGKKRYLEFNMARQNFTNDNSRTFYDLVPGGEERNDRLSNHFRRGYNYDRGGVNFLINRNKYLVRAGLAYQQSLLENKNLLSDQPFNARFSRILPSAAFEYEFKKTGRLDFNYATRFIEPSPEQLQPVVDNSDPLNIYVGNPNLQPEYMHELRAGYFMYDQFSFTSLFINLSGSYIKDRITNATTIDSLLRRTVTPVNVSRETALRGNVSFSTPVRPLGIKMRLQLNSRLTQRILFVNNSQNDVLDWRSGFDFSIENRNKEKLDAAVGIRLNNTLTDWSVNTSLNQQFVNHQWYTQVQYAVTGKWMVETQFDYTIYSPETFGERTVIPLWQAGITRYVLKNNRGRIRLSAFDLLDRNLGIQRNSSLNYLEEQRSNALSRYFLLSFGYSLSGFEKQQGVIEIGQ